MSWGRELAWDRKSKYDYEYSHEFDSESTSSYIDVTVKSKYLGNDEVAYPAEYKNYRLEGIVKFHLENGSIEEHKVPDSICDLNVDELTVYDMTDPDKEDVKMEKCPSDLESWLGDNLLDHISDD